MQPEKPTNYWQSQTKQDPDDLSGEMYQPSPQEAKPDQEVSDTYKRPSQRDSQLTWSAVEYIDSEKGTGWFIVFAIVILAFIAADIFLIQSYTFSILVVVMALAIIVLAKRPARTLHYTLSEDHGLYIGDKLYPFDEFKAFGLLKDRGQHCIVLIPVKRFSPSVSVYFPEEVGEDLVDIFGQRLPMEEVKLDAIDIVVQKLRL